LTKAQRHLFPYWLNSTRKGRTREELRRNTIEEKNTARILNVDEEVSPNTFRVNLEWQGNHNIADFDLERYGKVLSIQDEAENRGWAIIDRPFRAAIASRGGGRNESAENGHLLCRAVRPNRRIT
jgi:hypothetical protein